MGIADVAAAMQEAERRRLAAEGGGADVGGYPVTPGIQSVTDALTSPDWWNKVNQAGGEGITHVVEALPRTAINLFGLGADAASGDPSRFDPRNAAFQQLGRRQSLGADQPTSLDRGQVTGLHGQ